MASGRIDSIRFPVHVFSRSSARESTMGPTYRWPTKYGDFFWDLQHGIKNPYFITFALAISGT
jgi:hypothetical protein